MINEGKSYQERVLKAATQMSMECSTHMIYKLNIIDGIIVLEPIIEVENKEYSLGEIYVTNSRMIGKNRVIISEIERRVEEFSRKDTKLT